MPVGTLPPSLRSVGLPPSLRSVALNAFGSRWRLDRHNLLCFPRHSWVTPPRRLPSLTDCRTLTMSTRVLLHPDSGHDCVNSHTAPGAAFRPWPTPFLHYSDRLFADLRPAGSAVDLGRSVRYSGLLRVQQRYVGLDTSPTRQGICHAPSRRGRRLISPSRIVR